MKAFKSSASWALSALVALSVAAIAFGVYRSKQTAAMGHVPPRTAQAARPATLASLKPAIDLGTISMAAGTVPFRYLIKNTGAEPLDVNRVSTSCMCTSATVVTATERKGPFGMPGHGGSNATKLRLAPGELANVEVVFDPAAHGPSGLGRIERSVTLESAQAMPLELRMVAMVRP